MIFIYNYSKAEINKIYTSDKTRKFMENLSLTNTNISKFKSNPWLNFTEWYECLVLMTERKILEWERLHQLERACSAGCVSCCNQPIVIRDFEAKIIFTWIKQHKQHLIPIIEEWVEKFDKSLWHPPYTDPILVNKYRKNYFEKKYHCPFLQQKMCSIYPVRPINCIIYLSYDDPKLCSLKNDPETCLTLSEFGEWFSRQTIMCLQVNHESLNYTKLELIPHLLPCKLFELVKNG